MKKTVYLIRHGEIEESMQGKFVGHTDVSLSAEGRLQMKKVGTLLKRKVHSLKSPPALSIGCSPLKRTRESMQIALEDISIENKWIRNQINEEGANLYIDSFQEVHFGNWEGLSFEEIQKQDRERLQGWVEWNPQFSFPEGESISQFLSRIQDCVSWVHARSETILLFTHGGVIRFLACALLGMPWEEHHRFAIPRGSMLIWSAS